MSVSKSSDATAADREVGLFLRMVGIGADVKERVLRECHCALLVEDPEQHITYPTIPLICAEHKIPRSAGAPSPRSKRWGAAGSQVLRFLTLAAEHRAVVCCGVTVVHRESTER